MIDVRIVGTEIQVNGFKVAEIDPVRSLSLSEIQDFKDFINDYKPLVKDENTW